jgi:GntR family transcriptional regulator
VNRRMPRYLQIADALRERIHRGDLAPGTRLETQRALARRFEVTLMTLRQALEMLEREHLIERRHGLGTFVAAPSVDYDILQLRRFAGDLSAQGENVATRVLGVRFVRADRRAAASLRLSPRARLLELARLRLVDGRPMSLQRSFLSADVGEEVAKADLAVTPLHEVLEFKLGIVIVRATEAVSAVRLPRWAARELGCRPGVPALESERVSFGSEGEAIVFDHVFIPGDRFRITRELQYDERPCEPQDGVGLGPHRPRRAYERPCEPQDGVGWPGEPQHGPGLGPRRARRANERGPTVRGEQ